MVVEIHDAATIQIFTSPVAAKQLAAGVFLFVKSATRDFISPVAASKLATGAFLGENDHPGI